MKVDFSRLACESTMESIEADMLMNRKFMFKVETSKMNLTGSLIERSLI